MLLWIWGCRYLLELVFSLPLAMLGIFPDVELLEHMIILLLIFWASSILFCIAAVPTYIVINRYEDTLFFTSMPAFVTSFLFDDGHCNRHEVISHFGFSLYVPNDQWCRASFHVPFGLCISSLEKFLFRSFVHFLIGLFVVLVLGCMSSF